MHIAVLDDEADITLLLAGYLQRNGYRVSQVHDGPALLRLMSADPPQLVLLDLGCRARTASRSRASCASIGSAAW